MPLGRKNNNKGNGVNYISIPIHILGSELVTCLQEKIQKGKWISVNGCLYHFNDRLLISIHNKNGIRLLKTSANSNFVAAPNDNLSHAQLVWACNEEDMFMSKFVASEAMESSDGRGWLCEK